MMGIPDLIKWASFKRGRFWTIRSRHDGTKFTLRLSYMPKEEAIPRGCAITCAVIEEAIPIVMMRYAERISEND